MTRLRLALAALAPALLLAPAGAAEINVGVTVSATGPAASLGIPTRNTVALLPTAIAGVKVNWLVLDDATDSTSAVKNARKLTSENKVDVLVGSNTVPNSLAMIDVAAETGTPMISLAAAARIIEPVDAKKRWVFKTPQNDQLMAAAVADHMARRGIKTAAYIGFADAYGDGWWAEFSKAAEARGIKLVASERYNRPDTSVTGQVLKILAARPEAVLVGAAGTPAVLPQKTLVERGYQGVVYQTHGVTNPDFLRVGGNDVEGAFLPAGPVVVASQLPDSHPCKAAGLEFVRRYEAAYGPGTASSFGAHAWDAGLLLQAAIPVALKRAQPGTAEFRAALRDALEGVRDLRGAHGVFNPSPTDHLGLDERARVMVQVKGGAWQLLP
ncbi:MAG TPA: ABC transporter substrate-binding protein [Anaeromyxobacteraceae bacterium]|nr:ABC transporter substrate-binding protein [Anaeromyxobacteraceae bacterium]